MGIMIGVHIGFYFPFSVFKTLIFSVSDVAFYCIFRHSPPSFYTKWHILLHHCQVLWQLLSDSRVYFRLTNTHTQYTLPCTLQPPWIAGADMIWLDKINAFYHVHLINVTFSCHRTTLFVWKLCCTAFHNSRPVMQLNESQAWKLPREKDLVAGFNTSQFSF